MLFTATWIFLVMMFTTVSALISARHFPMNRMFRKKVVITIAEGMRAFASHVEYVVCPDPKLLGNNDQQDFLSLVKSFAKSHRKIKIVYSSDPRLIPAKSDIEPKCFWYLTNRKHILDYTTLEQVYLGRKRYNEEETFQNWNHLLDDRLSILQKGSRLSTSSPYPRESDLLLSLLSRISCVTKSFQTAYYSHPSNVKSSIKSDQTVVTSIDFAIQAILIRKISQLFPRDYFLAEETLKELVSLDSEIIQDILYFIEICLDEKWSKQELLEVFEWSQQQSFLTQKSLTQTQEKKTERIWIIDPIDGTQGFTKGLHYAIAVSLVDCQQPSLPLFSVIACPNLRSYPLLSKTDPQESIALLDPLLMNDDSTYPLFPDLNSGSLYWTNADEGLVYSRSLSMSLGSAYQITEEDHILDPSDQSVPIAITVPYEGSRHDHQKSQELFEEIERRTNRKVQSLPLHGQGKYCLVAAGVATAYLKISKNDRYEEKLYDHLAGQHLVRAIRGRVANLYQEPLSYDFTRNVVKNSLPLPHTNNPPGFLTTKKRNGLWITNPRFEKLLTTEAMLDLTTILETSSKA